jgi:cation:H+ antiporter
VLLLVTGLAVSQLAVPRVRGGRLPGWVAEPAGDADMAAVAAFLVGAVVSLATSWLLVSRLERVGERLCLSEALLGLVAALAADAPEVTAAVTAVASHQQRVGAGVVIGSNVFNLAALLGLGAVVAGRIGLHRKVVILGGTVAVGVAGVCLGVVSGLLSAAAGLGLVAVVLALYVLVLAHGWGVLGRCALPQRWLSWLASAVAEEELELEPAIRPRRGRWPDAVAAGGALVVVIAASVTMERAAVELGSRYAVPELVVGGLVLAGVTSLPNAVAAVYLAARGRGAATLSTALNSNNLNVMAGLLLPGAVIGLGRPSGQAVLITVWYLVLTTAVLGLALLDGGLGRVAGIVVIVGYVAFAASVAWAGDATSQNRWLLAVPFAVAGLAVCVRMAVSGPGGQRGERQRAGGYALPGEAAAGGPSGNGHRPHGVHQSQAGSPASAPSLLPGWPVRRLWVLGLALSVAVAAADAALGSRLVLIGLLIIGPCCVLLTGRWIPTGLTGLWAVGLAVILGVPDGIWGTGTHLAFLAAVTAVALASTLAAAVISTLRP